MNRAVHAALLGAAFMAWMPGHALAGAWDNVPPAWRNERYQKLRPPFRSLDDGLTTGSIRRAPQRPVTERPEPAGARR